MYLLTATIVKSNDIYTRIYFIFLKLVLEQTSKSFNTKFRPQQKGGKSSYKVRQLLAFFYNLVPLIFRLELCETS